MGYDLSIIVEAAIISSLPSHLLHSLPLLALRFFGFAPSLSYRLRRAKAVSVSLVASGMVLTIDGCPFPSPFPAEDGKILIDPFSHLNHRPLLIPTGLKRKRDNAYAPPLSIKQGQQAGPRSRIPSMGPGTRGRSVGLPFRCLDPSRRVASST